MVANEVVVYLCPVKTNSKQQSFPNYIHSAVRTFNACVEGRHKVNMLSEPPFTSAKVTDNTQRVLQRQASRFSFKNVVQEGWNSEV